MNRVELQDLKTLWQDKTNRALWQFYCPLCKVARRMPCKPKPSARHFIQMGLTSVMFTLATWNFFGLKGLVSFVPFWAIFEVVYRSRVRAALSCRNCGFDPYLFLQDIDRAKEEVSAHWKKKFAEKGIEFPDATR